jgi:hypothetical protein
MPSPVIFMPSLRPKSKVGGRRSEVKPHAAEHVFVGVLLPQLIARRLNAQRASSQPLEAYVRNIVIQYTLLTPARRRAVEGGGRHE